MAESAIVREVNAREMMESQELEMEEAVLDQTLDLEDVDYHPRDPPHLNEVAEIFFPGPRTANIDAEPPLRTMVPLEPLLPARGDLEELIRLTVPFKDDEAVRAVVDTRGGTEILGMILHRGSDPLLGREVHVHTQSSEFTRHLMYNLFSAEYYDSHIIPFSGDKEESEFFPAPPPRMLFFLKDYGDQLSENLRGNFRTRPFWAFVRQTFLRPDTLLDMEGRVARAAARPYERKEIEEDHLIVDEAPSSPTMKTVAEKALRNKIVYYKLGAAENETLTRTDTVVTRFETNKRGRLEDEAASEEGAKEKEFCDWRGKGKKRSRRDPRPSPKK